MNSRLHLAIGAVSALAIAALPLQLESLALASLEPASAIAKSGNGGGNGNGGGRGGGKGHSGSHGKSADAGGRAKSGGTSVGSGRVKSTFGQEMRVAKGKKPTDTKVARATRKPVRAVEVAALPERAPVPAAKPKEEKLNARLAGLNSLKRNYHAYLNSQDPRMASIRAFVLASANLDIANEKLTAAEAAFAARVTAAELEPYDDAVGVYDDPTLAELQDRLDQLENATVAPEDLDAWQAEKAALESLLDSAEADALAQAEDRAELASVGTDDEALRQALLDAANRNRIAQYGEENYVNDDVMDWAKDVLGVGEDFGKIDEVRETLD
jgi:hypothetical protein